MMQRSMHCCLGQYNCSKFPKSIQAGRQPVGRKSHRGCLCGRIDAYVEKVNLADVEGKEWAKRSDRLGQEWKLLRKQMRPGDELWYYKSQPRFLADEAGYALVRKGRPIAKVVTLMS